MTEEPTQSTNDMSGEVHGDLVQAGVINGDVHLHSAPPPPTTGDGVTDLVNALLKVPSIRDEPGRRTVLSRLRPEIGDAVPHHQRTRLHVFELVRTCQDYEGGLDDLLRVLRELEGDSIPVRHSADAVRRLAEERPESG
ncbi:effector-associated domain 2-containing protein [Lentzea sp. NPDC054927]